MALACGSPKRRVGITCITVMLRRLNPNAGLTNGSVTVSLSAFDDNVLPVPKRYVPLTAEQRNATTLTLSCAEAVRDARVKNESLTVTANTGADTTSDIALATAAYKTRQEDVLDKVVNESDPTCWHKAYIPAGGYLVLAADLAKAGILKLRVRNSPRR